MARRTLTIKRIDPWSVLKVGFLANLVLLGILLLAGRVVWFFIERLELIDRACEVASSVGFQNCGLNGGNIFRNALLLGLLGVVVQTGILVFGTFLHNLIAELTGGLSMTVVDDGPEHRAAATVPPASRSAGRSGPRPGSTAGVGAGARPAGSGAPPRPAAPAAPSSGSSTAAPSGAASSGTGSTGAGSATPGSAPRPTPGSGAAPTGQPTPPRPTAEQPTQAQAPVQREGGTGRDLFGSE